MARSPSAITGGLVAVVGTILLTVLAIPAGRDGQSAMAAPPTPVQQRPTTDAQLPIPASSIASGGGVTLHSVSVTFATSNRTFPGGVEARTINNNCLTCHSAGMVLNQPKMSRADWQAEVDKMRETFEAPIAAEVVPSIVDYLANLSNLSPSMIAGRQPDANHGAVIVAQGTPKGAPACAQCHAFNGLSDGSGAFPRLAGQSAYYLAKQLRDYAAGVRMNALMSPIAKALSPDDIADVSAYYSRIDAPFPLLKAPDPALVQRGKEVATLGDAAKGIESCERCHGPNGGGEPPAIPYLAGQYAHYIAFTLDMWQLGYRKTSPDDMAVTAHKLSPHETAAVAAYFQQER